MPIILMMQVHHPECSDCQSTYQLPQKQPFYRSVLRCHATDCCVSKGWGVDIHRPRPWRDVSNLTLNKNVILYGGWSLTNLLFVFSFSPSSGAKINSFHGRHFHELKKYMGVLTEDVLDDEYYQCYFRNQQELDEFCSEVGGCLVVIRVRLLTIFLR